MMLQNTEAERKPWTQFYFADTIYNDADETCELIACVESLPPGPLRG